MHTSIVIVVEITKVWGNYTQILIVYYSVIFQHCMSNLILSVASSKGYAIHFLNIHISFSNVEVLGINIF